MPLGSHAGAWKPRKQKLGLAIYRVTQQFFILRARSVEVRGTLRGDTADKTCYVPDLCQPKNRHRPALH